MKKSVKSKPVTVTFKQRELKDVDLRAVVGGGQTQAHTNDPR